MKNRLFISALLCGSLSGITASSAVKAADLALADLPLFLVAIKPSIMVMLDNSGSMKDSMYSSGFNPSVEYYGIFEFDKNYVYDKTIAVNNGAYIVTVDTTKTGAFVESNCTPSTADTTCWSGRFLNWLTTRRIDASRMVMVGGKLESTTGYNYGGGYQYKIVGNNEYADHDMDKSYGSSSQYSPIPDGMITKVYSPADTNNGAMLSSYDPYAKIKVGGGGGFIYDASGNPIGEFGTVSVNAKVDDAGDLLNSAWTSVSLMGSYTNPVVIAKPPTFNGGNPSVVRINNVTSTGFDVVMQEWEYMDGNHIDEDVSYIVMEEGEHSLPNSIDVKAGVLNTDSEYVYRTCDTAKTDYQTVSFTNSFSSTPVVISSVMTYSGTEAVTSRVWSVSTGSFRVALQEEGDPVSLGHNAEDIGYIAFEQGDLVDTTNGWMLEVGATSYVDKDTKTVNFSSTFASIPAFLAAMQTMNDAEAATLRLNSVTSSGAAFHVEEEGSCDTNFSHTNEDVGYVALLGSGALNVSLAVADKPLGLLQDLAPGVRLGVSFYRFDPTGNDIYNQNIQGGTLRFLLPKNPFVKKPSNTSLPAAEVGYRELHGYIGSAIDDIVDAVNGYPLVWGTTPIAENLWEVIQYFEQDSPYYSDVVSGFPDFELADNANPERDPFYYPDYSAKLYCTSPSVIIFTDGYPYKDADVPAAVQDYDEDNDSDDVVSTDINAQGQDNLDDVAHWAFCDRSKGSCPVPGTPDDGSRDLRLDLSKEQYLTIYTVGFADGNIRPVLQDAADNAGGKAYAAEDGKALKTALKQAFTDAVSRASFSAVAVNTGSITASSKLYQAVFDSNDWSGDIEAYAVNSDGSIATTKSWAASEQLPVTNPEASRIIFTYDGTTGQPFQWANISGAQQALLGSSDVLDYLRGDSSNEEAQGGSYRDRNKLLGDFINSAPVWVGKPSMHYPDNWGNGASETAYSIFKNNNSARTPIVYVGSNDGMMHAFNASTGAEVFAYVPSIVYPSLANLADPDYAHKYFVDGSPTVVDAYFSSAWHTVLTAGLNAGGQGIYALDVTSPAYITTETIGASNVLWEFDDSDDADLGYTFSQPNVVRLKNGSWGAIFGNGYNNTVSDSHTSTTGNAVLYILNISDGSIIKKIDTGEGTADDPTGNGRPNGLASVSPVDINGDSIVDYVYAGDLFGNLWKFDLSSSSTGDWGLAYSSPLFTACHGSSCTLSNTQPITTRPQVGLHPKGTGYMVYFGTGKYFENNDDTSASQTTQSFYGIWDKNLASLTSFDRDDLLQQEILEEINLDGDEDDDYRITSDNPIDWSTNMGWYIDLINTEGGNTDNKGERQISASILRDGRIIFTTMMPEDNPCSAGGTGWLMELDARDGSRLAFSPFDINDDNAFDEDDYIQATVDVNGDGTVDENDKVPPSGTKSEVGIIPMPAILSGEEEYKYTPGTTGDIQTTTENPGPGSTGRQSWRELDF
jgi:hypothetical protein